MQRLLTKAPLRMVLIIPFVLQVSAAVGLTAWLSIRNGQQAVNDVTRQLREETTARVSREIGDLLSTTQAINQHSTKTIQRDNLDLGNIRFVEDMYWDYIQTFPFIRGLGAGNQEGDILALFQRGEPGNVTYFLEYSTPGTQQRYVSQQLNANRQGVQTETIDRYIDARQRPWYQAAVQAQGPVWTDVYTSISAVEGHSLALNAARPVYGREGQLQGVVSVILDLGQVSQLLETIRFSPSGQIFIVEADGNLIGSSDGNNPVYVNGNEIGRLTATQSPNPLIRESAKYLQTYLQSGLDSIDQALQLEFKLDGKRQFLQVTPIQSGEQLKWFIVVVAPETDFMGQIYAHTRYTIWLCLGALALATGSGILTARWITQPLLQLSQAAKRMAQGQWKPEERRAAIAVAQTREISDLAQSFNQMALQLNTSFAVLQASEAHFRSMANNVPGCIFRYILRPDGSDAISYASPGCDDIWEMNARDIERNVTVIWDMVHPDDWPTVRTTIAASAQSLQTWQQEWRIITPSGHLKWLRGAGNPTRHPNGDVVWVTVISDVSDRKQTELALEQELLLSKTLFDTSIDGIVLLDHQGNVLQTSASFARMLGYTSAETCTLNLADWDANWPPEDLPALLQGTIPLPPYFETRHRRQDGSIYDVEISYSREVLNGKTVHVCICRNISDRKQAETRLQDLTDRLELAIQAVNIGIWDWDIANNHLQWDERLYELYGVRPEGFSGAFEAWKAVIHPEDLSRCQTITEQALRGNVDSPLEFRVLRPDGSVRYIESHFLVQQDGDGRPLRMIGVNLDITQRKQAEAQIMYSALHDSLTELPNRALLTNRLELALQRAQSSSTYHFAVLFLDLDRFKVINDSLGHLIGDQLLITVAHKLHHIVRPTDVAARLGGDEFVILLEHVTDIQAVVQVAERLLTEFEGPIDVDDHEVFITTSIGIVWGSAAYTSTADLLRDADIALYRAKGKGRARYEIFDAEMHTLAVKRMTLEHNLREAIHQEAFEVYYQPIVRLRTQQLVGFEALIRWQHSTQGFISPADFIPLAEETGMILPISRWMLHATCQQLARWRQQFPTQKDLRVSVNLSGKDLLQPNLVDTIRRILFQTQLPATALTLEITESILIENIENTIDLLQQLRTDGIRISIDDFGTGYSSLSYLYNLPADYLKIDQSFVSNMHLGDRNHKIVQTVVNLSDQLELEAIAEGIETAHHLEWLRALNCELGQGYWFSPPLTAEAVTHLLANEHIVLGGQG
jgi:diguanylate cyclase (GGDEF)-like protein/PAS domain S-box-containing protein